MSSRGIGLTEEMVHGGVKGEQERPALTPLTLRTMLATPASLNNIATETLRFREPWASQSQVHVYKRLAGIRFLGIAAVVVAASRCVEHVSGNMLMA